MNIISFLLILTSYSYLLDDLSKSQFGKTLESTILVYLNMDQESKVREVLYNIEDTIEEEQNKEDSLFQQINQQCEINLVQQQKELELIQFEKQKSEQEISQFELMFDQAILKTKQNELLVYEQNLNSTINEREKEFINYNEELQECEVNLWIKQELIGTIRYMKQEYNKKVFPQLKGQVNNKILMEVQQGVKEAFKKLNKLITKQRYNQFIKVLLNAANQLNQSTENYEKLLQLLVQIEKAIESNLNQLRQTIDDQNHIYQQNIQMLENSILSVQDELNQLNEAQQQQSDKIESIKNNIINFESALISKSQILEDKKQYCQEQTISYTEGRQQRNEMRNLLSKLIQLVEMDVFSVKDYYTFNGILRQ